MLLARDSLMTHSIATHRREPRLTTDCRLAITKTRVCLNWRQDFQDM